MINTLSDYSSGSTCNFVVYFFLKGVKKCFFFLTARVVFESRELTLYYCVRKKFKSFFSIFFYTKIMHTTKFENLTLTISQRLGVVRISIDVTIQPHPKANKRNSDIIPLSRKKTLP